MSENIQTWWWFRHAPPVNPEGLCYGQLDIDADFSNEDRLKELGSTLPVRRAAWLSSPLTRAFLTATQALRYATNEGREAKPELKTEPAFMEQSFGDWQRHSTLSLRHDPAFQSYMKNPAHICPPNGESMQEMFARVAARINEVREEQSARDHVVVGAHGGSIRAAIALATGENIEDTLQHKIGHLAGIKLYYDRAEQRWLPHFDRF